MNLELFKENAYNKLRKLNNVQTLHFSWRCSVYALPFLGSRGNFNYWKKDRQKFLYAIFYVLDFNANQIFNPSVTITINKSVFENLSKAAAIIISSIRNESEKSKEYKANTITSFTARRKASFARDVSQAIIPIYNSTKIYLLDDFRTSFNSIFEGAISLVSIADSNKIDLASIILNDLDALCHNKNSNSINLIDFYGPIWENFQKALKNEDCIFWGKIYESIYKNGLKIDIDALERRFSIPAEIQEKGANEVANFLEEIIKEGATKLNEARIIILGDKGAGKTCLARKLIDPNAPMTTEMESTAGVNTLLWKIEEENINIRIWDFAGHTVTHAVHQFFLSERCLYIMVYDGRTEERNRLEYWLNHMKNYGGDSKAFLMVNKRDQHSINLPINSLKEQYSIAGLHTFSIKDDIDSLKLYRKEIVEYIKNNPSWNNLEIPTNNYQVKEILENLFVNGGDKGYEYISKKEFVKIAKKHGVFNFELLLIRLHALGVSLWYKNMEEFDTMVLNPEWLSHGVYQIINWVNENKKHSISLKEFSSVFNGNKRYPIDKHKFLYKLMIHYELAFETTKGENLIIPHLLHEDRPLVLPIFPLGESLMLRYKSEQPLPPDTISRFIVRHNQEIKIENNNYLVWRFGVVLEDKNGNIALIREDDRTISVSVKGNDKTKYISKLRDTLNNIYNSYKSKKPELQYRIERFGKLEEVSENETFWLEDKKIFNHFLRNKSYYDDETNKVIPMKLVVNNYKIKAENLMYGGTATKIIYSNIMKYEPKFWEKIIAMFSGLFFLSTIIFLLLRNEPISDPNLVIFTRVILSFFVSLFGGSVPGYLNVSFNKLGLAIRAGGAIGLFIITYLITPIVL